MVYYSPNYKKKREKKFLKVEKFKKIDDFCRKKN